MAEQPTGTNPVTVPAQGRRVTASAWWLARLCVWPWVSGLPWQAYRVSWSGRLGTGVHSALESYINGKQPDWVSISAQNSFTGTQKRNALGMFSAGVRALQANSHEPPAMVLYRAEVAFSYSNDGTARVLAPEYHRDYSKAPQGAQCGTADVVELHPETGVLVGLRDWKTGLSREPYKQRAVQQVRFLVTMAAEVFGAAETVRATPTYLTKEGKYYEDPEFITAEQRLVIKAEALAVQQRIANRQGPTPGAHCLGCPVNARCTHAATKQR